MSSPETAPEGSSAIGRRRALARRERNASWLERREQILAAAAEAFRAKGYQATGISDIAARLGSDRANVYYYFASKQEIYFTLVRQAVEANVADVEAAAAETGSPTAKLVRVIESLATSFDTHYPYLHLYVQEDMRRISEEGSETEQHLRDLGRRYDAALLTIVRAGVARGEIRAEIDPRMLHFAVLGAVNWTHRWFTPSGRLSGEDIGRAFGDIFLRGFAAGPPS